MNLAPDFKLLTIQAKSDALVFTPSSPLLSLHLVMVLLNKLLENSWRFLCHHLAYLPFSDNLFEQEREPVNAKIYMHGDLAWNDFKIMICRSTTPDMVKMIAKIQEFIAQQHRNSIRALSSLRPHIPLTMGDVMSSLSSPVSTGSQVSSGSSCW